MKGSQFTVRNRFPKDGSGKDRSVRRFKSSLGEEVQMHGGKLLSFSIDDGTVRFTIEGAEAAAAVSKLLEVWKRASIKLAGSPLADFVEEDNLAEVRS